MARQITVIAHVGGVPVEETLTAIAPELAVTLGATSATLRARARRMRSRPEPTAKRRK
jgi:hypothetical protein